MVGIFGFLLRNAFVEDRRGEELYAALLDIDQDREGDLPGLSGLPVGRHDFMAWAG
jgi:hypothetical protein